MRVEVILLGGRYSTEEISIKCSYALFLCFMWLIAKTVRATEVEIF